MKYIHDLQTQEINPKTDGFEDAEWIECEIEILDVIEPDASRIKVGDIYFNLGDMRKAIQNHDALCKADIK